MAATISRLTENVSNHICIIDESLRSFVQVQITNICCLMNQKKFKCLVHGSL